MKNDEKLGRFISMVLRHKPESIGIVLDEYGYTDVKELLKAMNEKGKYIDMAMLERIVAENDKKRYSFNKDHTKIRANQGHSVAVDLQLKPKIPPKILYHGTATIFLESIQKKGLLKMSRQYVHLSKDIQTAVKVGQRHGKVVVLNVNAEKMVKHGYQFYLSDNGVWLCEKVPCQYLSVEL
ncbi:RNA 2'-phosphotransferase [Clostridium sp. MD294]|uniref:RNA 2'-phosphotransferase n=1 Tax=Clostridium sp. MD294 TaxID=97138 RepID=UPI0002C8B437|nr:RNA 2'-phosphotransferase [Clostridium sp. MD294]NDO47650.1 RNA 2'-phosphotransferase [Clostridium sp. MD294]USF30033.1 putative RNA 2'-phosphotransferase [Clostridium sp. MD294]